MHSKAGWWPTHLPRLEELDDPLEAGLLSIREAHPHLRLAQEQSCRRTVLQPRQALTEHHVKDIAEVAPAATTTAEVSHPRSVVEPDAGMKQHEGGRGSQVRGLAAVVDRVLKDPLLVRLDQVPLLEVPLPSMRTGSAQYSSSRTSCLHVNGRSCNHGPRLTTPLVLAARNLMNARMASRCVILLNGCSWRKVESAASS